MKIPLLDLKAQLPDYRDAVLQAITRHVDEQSFILGPTVSALEKEIAALCRVEHGVGVSSGTDALLVSLMALGIGPGDDVITTPFTFFATAGVIARLGARPVFVDIDPGTFNISSEAVQTACGRATRAVIPVHLFGQVAALELYDQPRGERPAIVEDGAQSLGAALDGRHAGELGDLGCFSFFPSKNLGCFGDGGMVVTRDGDLAGKLRSLRVHGAGPKYHHPLLGGNFRLDTLQAAVLRVKLPLLSRWSAGRQRNAAIYGTMLQEAGLVERGLVRPPVVQPNAEHVYNQYTIRAVQRDALATFLAEQGVGTAVYYPEPLHLQPCLRYLGYGPGDFPESERACREVLSLPVYAELSKDQLAHVVGSISRFYGV